MSNEKELTGKVAMVTGAAQGIGKACAVALAKRGASLVLVDTAVEKLDQTCSEIISSFCATNQPCFRDFSNVFSRRECDKLVDITTRVARRIDILVSVPATNIRKPFLTYDPEDFDRVVRETLTAGFYLAQLVAQHMVTNNIHGKIVFIGSRHATKPYKDCVAYDAAKAGLNQMARTIALELQPHRINVNVVNPGWIDTPGERAAFGDARIEEEGKNHPRGRLGTPEDIGNAVAFLASSEADYITGTALAVYGGL